MLDDADRHVRRFARRYGWQVEAGVPSFARVELFDDQAAFWKRALELAHAPLDSPLPGDGTVALIEDDVLLAVTPDEYRRKRPEYAGRNDAWMRLVAHEIAHRLHVRILRGDEGAMGPPWFYEGFAVVASGQRFDDGIHYRSAAQAIAATKQGGRGAYARYAAVLRYFLRRHTLPKLVARAGDADFEAWLLGEPN